MQETGFLETAASRTADITVLLEMGMGAGLFAGAWLARAGRIRYHAACQAVIVLLKSSSDRLDDAAGVSWAGASSTSGQDRETPLRAGCGPCVFGQHCRI